MSTIHKKTCAGIGAASIGAFALMALAGTASAAAPANIDEGRDGSINIQKLERPSEVGEAVDGTEQSTDGLNPIEGVTFQLQRVEGIDLTQTDDWDGVAEMSVEDAVALGLGDPVERVTDANGEIVFDGLDLGLYLVTETGAPSHVTAHAKPFLVAVPTPSANVGDWIYDVYVYPKNSVGSADKTVDDEAALALGDEVTWNLGAAYPVVDEGLPLSQFVITDQLDERLVYVDGSVELSLTAGSGDTTPLSEGDYTAEYDEASRTLRVELSEEFLATPNADPEARLLMSFRTQVVGIGDGTIENEALFNIGEAEFTPDAVTNWGAVRLLKHAEGDEEAVLAGATFQVYASQADAEARQNAIEVLDGDDLVTDFVTGEDGTVLIPGLNEGTYYIAETQAPAGYIGSDEVYEVTVTAGGVADAVQVRIANVQRDTPELPNLGAAGMAAATVIGLALIGGGAAFAIGSRSRKATADN